MYFTNGLSNVDHDVTLKGQNYINESKTYCETQKPKWLEIHKQQAISVVDDIYMVFIFVNKFCLKALDIYGFRISQNVCSCKDKGEHCCHV